MVLKILLLQDTWMEMNITKTKLFTVGNGEKTS